MTTRTRKFVTQSSSSANSKNSPKEPQMMTMENVWTTIFIVVFPGELHFWYLLRQLTHKKKIDKVFRFVF